MVRTHVVLSEDLVRAVDALAGKRRRSRFIEDAVREKLKRETLLSALRETAGTISSADHPHWDTPEQVASWVRDLRRESDRRIDRPQSG